LVINFVNAWNNLIYPLAFSSERAKCLSVKITEVHMNIAAAAWGKPWHLVSALGMVMVIPVIVLILVGQKAIVRGLTSGAVK
jgi:ABC-type glycerol-3-phosphate transport system permease component